MPSSLPPAFQWAKQAVGLARADVSRDFPAKEMAWDAQDATDGGEKLQLTQRALEYYPYCVSAWSVLGYYCLFEEKNLQASIEAFQTGMEAARRVDPTLVPERTEPLEWSFVDNRPYLRVVSGLAQTSNWNSGVIS
jgi:hypothetical protein